MSASVPVHGRLSSKSGASGISWGKILEIRLNLHLRTAALASADSAVLGSSSLQNSMAKQRELETRAGEFECTFVLAFQICALFGGKRADITYVSPTLLICKTPKCEQVQSEADEVPVDVCLHMVRSEQKQIAQRLTGPSCSFTYGTTAEERCQACM